MPQNEGKLFKEWLKQRGIKVNEVAEKLGVGRHSVNPLEANGTTLPMFLLLPFRCTIAMQCGYEWN